MQKYLKQFMEFKGMFIVPYQVFEIHASISVNTAFQGLFEDPFHGHGLKNLFSLKST